MTRKPRTTPQVLDSIAKDGRFSREEVEGLREEIAGWAEKADEFRDKFNTISELDLDISTDGLESVAVLTDPSDPNSVRANPFDAVIEAIETLQEAKGVADSIQSDLSDFISAWESLEEYSESWLDEDADKEDIADARAEMAGSAEELREKIDSLDYLFGIKVEELA